MSKEAVPFPKGCLVLMKDGTIGRVKVFSDSRYSVRTADGDTVTTKRVKSMKTQTAVTLCFDEASETPMLDAQPATVTKYLADGQYQCLLLTVVPGHPGGYITVSSDNLQPGCENPLKKRKREEAEAAAALIPTPPTTYKLPRTGDQHEKEWTEFLAKKHESLEMAQIPWPDDPSQQSSELRFAFLEKQLSADRGDLEGKVLRKLRLRWHPDRFNSRYGKLVPSGKSREAVEERVAEISAYINRDVETCGRWRSKNE